MRISPKTIGLPPGTDTSLGAMPRFSIMAAMASALRWMFARSLAMFGIESRRDELVDDGSFVLLAPGAGRLRRRIRLRGGCSWQQADQNG